MNVAALAPYAKELVRSISTAIVIFAGAPKCPDCLVSCAPAARCPDCICQGSHRAPPEVPSCLASYVCCVVVGFLVGVLAHWQWCKAFTVIGSRTVAHPAVQFKLTQPRSSSPTLTDSPITDLPRISEDSVEVSSTASSTNDSEFQSAARAQVALLRKSKNGGSR